VKRGKQFLLVRSGIILTGTGIVVLAVHGIHHRLPLWGTLAVGCGLVVVGVPILIAGMRARSNKHDGSEER
jgi:hypothetical protein